MTTYKIRDYSYSTAIVNGKFKKVWGHYGGKPPITYQLVSNGVFPTGTSCNGKQLPQNDLCLWDSKTGDIVFTSSRFANELPEKHYCEGCGIEIKVD